MTSPLNLADLLPDDVSVGQLGHEKWHDYLHQSVKAMKNLLVTLDDAAVKKTGDQTIDGTKTFTSPVVGVAPTQNAHLSTKLYVDQGLSGKTNTGHTHIIANITSLQSTLDLKAPLDNPTFTGTVGGITKSMVGLANADNTADTAKPVSTLQQTALNGKLSLTGGTLTGILDSTSYAIFRGAFAESQGNAGVYIGTLDTPRIQFAGQGTQSTNWQIDNYNGQFRWYQPGAVHMTLQSGYLDIKNKTIDNVVNPTTSQQAATKSYVDTSISTGVVKTTTDQTIAGVKSFTSAPKLKSTSTAGYAWVATGSDGSGDWSAIVNAPGGTVPWANITGRPSTFTPEAHVHAITDVTSLSSTLSGKVDTNRTVTAGTGLTGGGDLSANRTFAVVYGTTASSAAQGNDSRLSDTRIPTDLSVTTAKIADANITLPKLATTAKPYDISFVQSLDTRAVGYGEMVYGVLINKSITLTSIHYRLGTADASGTTTAQIYTATTADGAKTAVAGTSGTAAVNPTPITGSVSIAAGTYLFVYTSAIGTTPGKGLIAEIQAYLT